MSRQVWGVYQERGSMAVALWPTRSQAEWHQRHLNASERAAGGQETWLIGIWVLEPDAFDKRHMQGF